MDYEIVFEPGLQQAAGTGLMYQDRYIVLLRDAVRFRDGTIGPYVRTFPAAAHGGAAVLPILDGKIVLLRHFRHATRAWHWEIPRGYSDGDETPEQTARREIKEELGVDVTELSALGTVHPDTGHGGGSAGLYLARLPHLGRIEAREGIDEIRQISPAEFDTMARAQQITDSYTLAAVLQARIHGRIG